MKLTANHTVAACFTGLTIQAIVINLPPLLYLTFENEFGISLSKISLLIAISFFTQLLMDFTASKLPSLFNNQLTVIIGQVFCVCGLLGMALLPSVIPPYVALIISTSLASFGSGIIEVMGNPIIEASPIKNKNRILSVMHSCYCWGLVLTVLLSTLFFKLVGIENWRILFCLWAIIPAINTVAFIFVPLPPMESAPLVANKKDSVFRTFTFWVFFLLMLCAGAAEMTMTQWASSFAEMGLKVDKSTGDLLGPCTFALFMAIGRTLFSLFGSKINIQKALTVCAVSSAVCYAVIAFAPSDILSLAACALSGFAVSIMWPSTLDLASSTFYCGAAAFSILSVAGDIGCTLGPSVNGVVADIFAGTSFAANLSAKLGLTAEQLSIRLGFALNLLFPVIMALTLIYLSKKVLCIKDGK